VTQQEGFIENPREKFPILGHLAVIPIEWLPFFEEDPVKAAMEYLSYPSGSVNPFFRDSGKVRFAIKEDRPNPLNWETYTLDPLFQAGTSDRRPRYMHVDLAINNDGAGIAMSHCAGFKAIVQRKDDGEFGEVLLPIVDIDFAGILRPRLDRGEREIDYDAILELIFDAEDRGFNLRSGVITLDRFQSHQFKKTLFKQGFNVGALSVDHTTSQLIVDYDKPERVRKESVSRQPAAVQLALRDALYQDRCNCCQIAMHPVRKMSWLEKEAGETQADYSGAQRLLKAVKVEGGSDDLIQAIAGAVYNCSNNAQMSIPEPEQDQAAVHLEQSFYAQFGRDSGGVIPQDVIDNAGYENPRMQRQSGGDPFYNRMNQDAVLGL